LSAHALLPPASDVIYSACWPIAEKILVVSQSLNALIYGHIRQDGLKRQRNVYAFGLFLTVSCAFGVVLLTAFGEHFVLKESYRGISVWMVVVATLFVIQSMRIMAHTASIAIGRSARVFIDGVVLLVAIFALTEIGSHYQLISNSWIWAQLVLLLFSAIYLFAPLWQVVNEK
jgi:hypothetical protein